MKRCTSCCVPDSRPDTEFKDGVCSACLNYAARPAIDWDARRGDLIRLLDRHDGRVIVPSSGGKDSTYIALTLKDLGADVTAVTARTCMLTPIGRHNIDNLARHVRTIEIVPNMTVRAKLNRIGLTMVGDISLPEHWAIFTQPFQVADDTGINLLMYGENSQNQYGGPLGTEAAQQLTRRWRSEFGGFLGLRPSDVIGIDGITKRDILDYELPDDEQIESLGIEAHFLGQYIPWDSHWNARCAAESGFQYQRPTPANWWEWENQDNAQTGVHDFFGYLKYGYGRGCAQISCDIRAGRVTRDDAMEWIKMHDGMPPDTYMDVPLSEVLHALRMSQDDFHRLCQRYMNRDIHLI